MTLIEVLVSMAILVAAGAALLEAINSALRSTRNDRDLTRAVYLTRGRMATLANQYSHRPNAVGGFNQGNYGEDFPGFRWESQAREVFDEESWYLRVVTWYNTSGNASKKERFYELVTIVPRYKEPPVEEQLNQRRQERGSRRQGAHSRIAPEMRRGRGQ